MTPNTPDTSLLSPSNTLSNTSLQARILVRSREPEEYYLADEKRISGNPKQTVWMDYTDPSGQFMVGTWRSEPGKWHIHYTEEEYCYMLEGRSIITHEDGSSLSVQAGDEFIIPAGLRGTWEVIETSTKRFVIYEQSNAAT